MITIIDVAHLAWQAWHARTSTTGAFDGLRGRLATVSAGRESIVLAVDLPPYLRADIYPDYKANRSGDVDGKVAVKALLAGLRDGGWRLVGSRGHEADDVIATLVAECERRGLPCEVVTGDKDLWCLADRCTLLDTAGKVVDRSAVAARFGVTPAQLPDLLALAGDTSDNIPGAARADAETEAKVKAACGCVVRVGNVGASKLLAAWLKLASVLAAEPPTLEELTSAGAELEALQRKARKKTATEADAAIAKEAARKLNLDKLLAAVHASRADVELSARLVALDFAVPLTPEQLASVFGDPPRQAYPAPDRDAFDGGQPEQPPPVMDRDIKPENITKKRKPPMPESRYNFTATEAAREQITVRAGFCGTTGSGKTYTALTLGSRMVDKMGTGPLFVIDTEHKSALRYAYSARSRQGFRFKHVPMPEDDCSPAAYLAALKYCEDQGAGVVLIDSLSHLWNGIGGVLEQVDKTTDRSRSKNAFSEGWKEWTPIHARTIERIHQSPAHVLFTLRAKSDWVITKDERTGKNAPQKVGLAPIAREGIDYEPDLFFVMEPAGKDTWLWVDKSRVLDAPTLSRGSRHVNPGDDFAEQVIAWAQDGEAPVDPLGVEVARAVEASADRPSYEAAKGALAAWMGEHRVSTERGQAALAALKVQVTAKLAAPVAA